ncbi:MAG: GNAT family N-acetyltransferase [Vulcanimicrobiota bacterium]
MSFVEFLGAHHDRQSFDCGKEPLNRFLREQARQNADRHLGVTYVVVPTPGSSQIQGYFTLVTRTVESQQLPTKKKRLPTGPIGVILLGRLAVDQRFQGQKLGQRMLLRAMAQVEHAGQQVGVYALVLDTIDEQARNWYLSLDFGFQPLPENPERLFVTLAFIQQLGLGPLTDKL